MVVKPNARKLRRLAEGVVGGFAGVVMGTSMEQHDALHCYINDQHASSLSS